MNSKVHIDINQSKATFANEEGNKDTMDRKHGCDVCMKRFKTKWHLTEHMIVHTGIYPFQCVSCKKGFKRRKALETHPCIYDNCEQEDRLSEHTPTQGIFYTCPHYCMEEFTSRADQLR